ncbi:MAG: DUF1326 domain-containing protein [Planctomycetes bacterium]|nr:DUF1326 domain-containing protein [Planctomycetota bacterium]
MFVPCCLVSLAALGAPAVSAEPVILGEYVEARTCDVWTGPCFANGEMNLRGDQAVLGWVVRKGSWDGVELKDLAIVAAIDAEGTLTTSAEGKVRAMVYVDEKATEEQAKALLSMAAALAPKYVKDTVRIERRRISYAREEAQVSLQVGELAEVRVKTVPLSSHCDSICGNESGFYPSLAKITHLECAKTLENSYSGTALGLRWSDPNKRSAILGRFAL